MGVRYGRPPWNPQTEEQLDRATIGRLWRLGDNFWTNLDTNLPLKISGVEVPAGNYYLAVERPSADSWNLALIDPAQARKIHLDPYETISRTRKIPAKLRAPLTFQEVEESAQRLTITVDAVPGPSGEGVLTIHWGNLQLKADVLASVPKPD